MNLGQRLGRAATAAPVREGFYKSSFSGSAGCVEIQFYPEQGSVRVRDSKESAGPELNFTPIEWAAFLAGVKSGEFETPAQWNDQIPRSLVIDADRRVGRRITLRSVAHVIVHGMAASSMGGVPPSAYGGTGRF